MDALQHDVYTVCTMSSKNFSTYCTCYYFLLNNNVHLEHSYLPYYFNNNDVSLLNATQLELKIFFAFGQL